MSVTRCHHENSKLAAAARRHLPKEPPSGFPHNPEPILRSPFRAHGLKAQNAFDWFDPRLSTRSSQSVEIMNETTSKLEHPYRPHEHPACQGNGTPARTVSTRSTVVSACAEPFAT